MKMLRKHHLPPVSALPPQLQPQGIGSGTGLLVTLTIRLKGGMKARQSDRVIPLENALLRGIRQGSAGVSTTTSALNTGARCCVSAAILAQDMELPRADQIFRIFFVALQSLSTFSFSDSRFQPDSQAETCLADLRTTSRKCAETSRAWRRTRPGVVAAAPHWPVPACVSDHTLPARRRWQSRAC